MSIHHETASVPITALAYLNGYIAGVGNSLRIIDDTCRTVVEAKVFDSQIIHGVVVDDRTSPTEEVALLIWGGRRIRLAHVRIARGKSKISFGPELVASDWILDARFNAAENIWPEVAHGKAAKGHLRAALVTAHNSLLELEWKYTDDHQQHVATTSYGRIAKEASSSQASLVELTTASRCILYSANLAWLSKSRILVAAGTVFGEIIVWSCNVRIDKGGSQIEATTHNVFTGHEGSVFGVRISPPLANLLGGNQQRLLASCSDDRTIRIWQIASIGEAESTAAPREATDQLLDSATGFSTHAQHVPVSSSIGNSQIAWTWAHASRIWNVHFIWHESFRQTASLTFKLVSVGEDATCRFWDLLRDEAGKFALRHTYSSEHHSGKNIWSSIMVLRDSGKFKVATGGADGSTVLHDTLHIGPSANLPNAHEEWTIADIPKTILVSPSHDKKLLCQKALRKGNGADDLKQNEVDFSPHENEAQAARPRYFQSGDDGSFGDYAIIRPDTFVTTTKAGALLHASLNSEEPWVGSKDAPARKKLVKWLRVVELDDLRNHSVLSKSCVVSPLFNTFIGVRSGIIYRYDDRSGITSGVAKLDGRVSGLFLDSVEIVVGDPEQMLTVLSLTATIGGGKLLHNFLFNPSECDCDHMESSHSRLQLPSGFVVTSLKHVCIGTNREALFVGSRNKGIAIYSVRRPHRIPSREVFQSPFQDSDEAQPTLVLDTAHGKEAVTSLSWLSDTRGATGSGKPHHSGLLFSTGRDGTYAVHHLIIRDDSICSLVIHKLQLPFGPYIEGLLINAKTNHLLLWGFRNKCFVLWDETAAEESMNVDCGGAHRSWAFYPDEGGQGGVLVWTKAHVCKIYHQQHSLHQIIQRGGHGREIKSVAVAPVPLCSNGGSKYLIATGAEDTDIRIYEYAPATSVTSKGRDVFHCVRTVRKHNTGIQHLQWSEDGKWLFSSGGFEEFFVWRVRFAPVISIAVVCESVLPFQSEVADLRITSFVAQSHGTDPAGPVTTAFDIACTYSDSTIRMYRYQAADCGGTWQHLYTGAYGPNHTCLTGCIFLSSDATLLTAGGDGHVAFWHVGGSLLAETISQGAVKFDPELTPQTYGSRYKIHQSSIKALAYRPLGNGKTLLLTGGDDNALGISIIQAKDIDSEVISDHPDIERDFADTEKEPPLLRTLLIPRAHAAAITAVALVGGTDPDSAIAQSSQSSPMLIHAVTSSNDQRIKTWKLLIDSNVDALDVSGVQVERLANESTGVADLADIAVLPSLRGEHVRFEDDYDERSHDFKQGANPSFVVCGVGMEVWRLS